MLLRCRARLQLTPHRMVLMRTYYIIESPPQATPPQFNSFAFLNFQTPTQSQLFVFLSIFMLLGAAHADESAEIALHNGDVRGDLSVVKNWTLICEQLCRWVVLVKLQNLVQKTYKKPVFSLSTAWTCQAPLVGLIAVHQRNFQSLNINSLRRSTMLNMIYQNISVNCVKHCAITD